MRYLIDTDVIIDHEKGVKDAYAFFQEINRPGNQLFISVITMMELYAGLSPDTRRQTESLLEQFEIIIVDLLVAKIASDYLFKYQRAKGIGLADAAIAATAQLLDAKLVTRNKKHFPMTDIEVVVPF